MTFSYGDRVVVKNVPAKYSKYYLEIREALGTVMSVYGSNIAVKLDNFCHASNSHGFFYFGPGELRFESITAELFRYDDKLDQYIKHDVETTRNIINKLESEMEENTMPTNLKYDVPMLPNYTVVGVKYPSSLSKEYAFASYENDLNIGDTVVVRNSNGGLALVEVASIGLLDKSNVLNGCEVVCKVDLHASENRYAKAKEIADLKREMDEKVAQLQATALYEMMAEKDPSLKILLEQFKELTK